jgi:Fur family ferric uptake transcriptional regulator
MKVELKAAGLRVTAQRLSVLAVLREQRRHLRADQILGAVNGHLKTVSTQAVYSALAALCETGLVRRIEPANSAALYEARVADNHHHLVCRGCGEVVDVNCLVGNTPCLEPSPVSGFVIEEAEITFWGLCPTCAQVTKSPKMKSTRTKEADHA